MREQYLRFRKIYFLRKQEKNFAYANLFYVRAHLIIILRSRLYYFEQARRLTCLRDHMYLRVQIDIFASAILLFGVLKRAIMLHSFTRRTVSKLD